MGTIAIGINKPEKSESGIEFVRERLSAMSHSELLRFGVITKSKSIRTPLSDQHRKEVLEMQIREARAEWKRRFPGLPLSESF